MSMINMLLSDDAEVPDKLIVLVHNNTFQSYISHITYRMALFSQRMNHEYSVNGRSGPAMSNSTRVRNYFNLSFPTPHLHLNIIN
jgi:hypothetical protein